jgi:hypothetical protein
MKEQEWLSFTKVTVPVMNWLHRRGSARRFYLAGCAAVRHLDPLLLPQQFHDLIELVERFADGRATDEERARAHRRAEQTAADLRQAHYTERGRRAGMERPLRAIAAACHASMEAGWESGYSAMAEAAVCGKRADQWAWQSDMLRDLFGNPFRPVTIDRNWLAWHDGTVVKLAEAAYEHRELPSGHFEAARLALLADALEEAGCGEEQILSHLRGPGPHVRGCWVVDLVLGKE